VGKIFNIDGPFYRIGNILYYLMVTNLIWVLTSIPIITMGASTTSLFYIMGKVIRDEDIKVLRDYWKSFKMNFKQATVIWVVLLLLYAIVYINIENMALMGSMERYIKPIQYFILIELTIMTIYIFPLLSRYHITTKNLLKASFFIGSRHLLTTALCLASAALIVFLTLSFTGLFILLFVSLYALVSYYLIQRVTKRYMPENQETKSQDETDQETEEA
jgi:uncharacterized membrane protein YesL